MSGATSRLRGLFGHLGGGHTSAPSSSSSSSSPPPSPPPQPQPSAAGAADAGSPVGLDHRHHVHQLSPTFFLERAAAIEPDAVAIYHITANGRVLRRPYAEFADRARGLAYYLRKRRGEGGRRPRVGVLAPNTPAFLESIFGIVAAAGVLVPVNYRYVFVFVFSLVSSPPPPPPRPFLWKKGLGR